MTKKKEETKATLVELTLTQKEKNKGKSRSGKYTIYQIDENDQGIVGSIYFTGDDLPDIVTLEF